MEPGKLVEIFKRTFPFWEGKIARYKIPVRANFGTFELDDGQTFSFKYENDESWTLTRTKSKRGGFL